MNEAIIAITFRLLNFAVLIALFIYIFKKYILPTILIRIGQKEALLRQLFNKQQALEQEQYALGETVAKEAQLCAELKKKVQQWKKEVDQEFAERTKEKTEGIKQLKQKTQQRAQWYGNNKIKKEVLTAATAQAKVSLKKQFADPKKGHNFIQPIIDFMRKGVS